MATTIASQVLASNACLITHADKQRRSICTKTLATSKSLFSAYSRDLYVGSGYGIRCIHRVPQGSNRHQQRFHSVRAEAAEVTPAKEANSAAAAEGVTSFKHILLPILDRNPYLSEATRQVTATAAGLAKKFGADVTVVVIDEDARESIVDHDARMKSIRWHMAEGGFEDFGLLERLGEGKKPAAVVGEVADDLNLDLVVMSMESIHHKHIDGNLLAEFVPCPILLLP